MKALILLGLEQVAALGQVAYAAHEDTARRCEPKKTDKELTQLSLTLKKAIEQQRQWLKAITETIEAYNVEPLASELS